MGQGARSHAALTNWSHGANLNSQGAPHLSCSLPENSSGSLYIHHFYLHTFF